VIFPKSGSFFHFLCNIFACIKYLTADNYDVDAKNIHVLRKNIFAELKNAVSLCRERFFELNQARGATLSDGIEILAGIFPHLN
jgi:hypothetical protein